jgi:hypothetical protein
MPALIDQATMKLESTRPAALRNHCGTKPLETALRNGDLALAFEPGPFLLAGLLLAVC